MPKIRSMEMTKFNGTQFEIDDVIDMIGHNEIGGNGAYTLANAETPRSAYSIGKMQTDFGVKTIDGSRQWEAAGLAKRAAPGPSNLINAERITKGLMTQGNKHALSKVDRNLVNAFTQSNAGRQFVDQLDQARAKEVIQGLQSVISHAKANPRYSVDPTFTAQIHSPVFQAMVLDNINQFGTPKSLRGYISGKTVGMNKGYVSLGTLSPLDGLAKLEKSYAYTQNIRGFKDVARRRSGVISHLGSKGFITATSQKALQQQVNNQWGRPQSIFDLSMPHTDYPSVFNMPHKANNFNPYNSSLASKTPAKTSAFNARSVVDDYLSQSMEMALAIAIASHASNSKTSSTPQSTDTQKSSGFDVKGFNNNFEQKEQELQAHMNSVNAAREEFDKQERDLQSHMDRMNAEKGKIEINQFEKYSAYPTQTKSRSTSVSNTQIAQNQTQTSKKEVSKNLDHAKGYANYAQGVAQQNQGLTDRANQQHGRLGSAAQPTNPDFDAKHGITSTNKSTGKSFAAQKGPTTNQLASAQQTAVPAVAQQGPLAKSKPTPKDIELKATPPSVKVALNVKQATQAMGDVKGTKDIGWEQKSINRGVAKAEAQSGKDTKGMSPEEAATALGFKGDKGFLGLNRDPVTQMRDSMYSPDDNRQPYSPHTRQSLKDEIAAQDKKNKDYDEKNSSSSSSAERVVCTELLRQNKFDKTLYELDVKFSKKYLSRITIRGYHAWAIPLVLKMRKSKRLTAFIQPFAIARAEEISYQLGYRAKGNLFGKTIRLIGEPLCFAIGLFSEETEWKYLYQAG